MFFSESVFVELTLRNPLDVGMLMNDVQLVCDFTPKQSLKDDVSLGADSTQAVRSDVIASFAVEPRSRTKVCSG
jgi:hypothetical protein